MNSLAAFLMEIEPFNRLPAEEVERLSLLAQLVHHAKGEVLYNEGENAVYVWVLQTGRLEIFKYNMDGKPLAIESIQPKQLFGTLCRLGPIARTSYPCTAIAATDSISIRIPDRFFQGLYNRFPAMVFSTCQLCSLRLGSMQQRATTYQEPVRTRIVRTLFQLQKTNGNELPYTKREISELAATTVETTIRVLSVLEKKRWVASERGKIRLKDISQLQSLLRDDPSTGSSTNDVPAKTQKRRLPVRAFTSVLARVVLLAQLSSSGFSMGLDVLQTEKFDLTIGGRAQLIGYAENVADPIRDNNRVFLFLKQARLNLHGRVADFKYNTEWAFAAEDINGSNTSLTLLDFSFDIPFPKAEGVWIKAGQFKIPYSRERLAYSGNLQFADRSLQNIAFNMGRDVGLAVHGQREKWAGTFGVFTGGGRDVPQRFLPETLGFPLVVARAGWNDGVDKDIYTVTQNDLDIQSTQKAAFVNALYMKDTLIGHNTVFGVKTAEKSILLNSNWNPYIAATPLVRGDLFQGGGDLVLRVPLSEKKSWTGELEANYGEFSNRYGTVHLMGGRAQTAILINKTEFGLRYSALIPDDAFRKNGVNITRKKVMNEIAPAVTYYFRGHDLKVILDAPVLLNVPVAIEKGPTPIGAYVVTEQPDQTTNAVPPNGELQHQTVTQVRLMLQVAF